MKFSKPHLFLIVISFALFLGACKINYTFSGADVCQAKTLSIAYFPNKAPLVTLSLSQVLTEKLKDKFSRETPLTLVQQQGDMQISGEIFDYNIAPVSLQGGTSAALNRLTIRVRVTFVNKTCEEKNYEQEFTGFADYDANANFTAKESELIQTITGNLVQDIFNKSVINW